MEASAETMPSRVDDDGDDKAGGEHVSPAAADDADVDDPLSEPPTTAATAPPPPAIPAPAPAPPALLRQPRIVAQKWRLEQKIGQGSFAVVWRASHVADAGVAVAVKEVLTDSLSPKLRSALANEAETLRTCSASDHVLSLIEVIEEKDPGRTFLVSEFCDGGDLAALLRSRPRGRMSEAEAKELLKQLASGLRHLWSRSCVHRDLKPHNLLLLSTSKSSSAEEKEKEKASAAGALSLDDDVNRDPNPSRFVLKIADFGFARCLEASTGVSGAVTAAGSSNSTPAFAADIPPPATSNHPPLPLADTLCGSPLYMAPEILQHRRYDAKADLWSVGAILFEMVCGAPPFGGSNHLALLRDIERREASLPPDVAAAASPQLKDLLAGLLRRDPVSRISFEEFFEHEWLTGVVSARKRAEESVFRSTPTPTGAIATLPAGLLSRAPPDSTVLCLPLPPPPRPAREHIYTLHAAMRGGGGGGAGAGGGGGGSGSGGNYNSSFIDDASEYVFVDGALITGSGSARLPVVSSPFAAVAAAASAGSIDASTPSPRNRGRSSPPPPSSSRSPSPSSPGNGSGSAATSLAAFAGGARAAARLGAAAGGLLLRAGSSAASKAAARVASARSSPQPSPAAPSPLANQQHLQQRRLRLPPPAPPLPPSAPPASALLRGASAAAWAAGTHSRFQRHAAALSLRMLSLQLLAPVASGAASGLSAAAAADDLVLISPSSSSSSSPVPAAAFNEPSPLIAERVRAAAVEASAALADAAATDAARAGGIVSSSSLAAASSSSSSSSAAGSSSSSSDSASSSSPLDARAALPDPWDLAYAAALGDARAGAEAEASGAPSSSSPAAAAAAYLRARALLSLISWRPGSSLSAAGIDPSPSQSLAKSRRRAAAKVLAALEERRAGGAGDEVVAGGGGGRGAAAFAEGQVGG